MMFVLTCEIKIGAIRLTAVNHVQVKRSIYTLGDTAIIKLPVTAILRQSGQPAVKIETAQAVKIGDKVEIKLGYNNRIRKEFVGYVKRINRRIPIEIECEDEFYQCRNRNVKVSATITLADLLKKCGLKVGYCETLTLKNYTVPDKTVSSVLANLNTKYGLCVFFDLDGKIYVCRPEKVVSETVKYECRKNIINDDDLQYQKKEDLKVQIKAICIKKDGTKIEAKKGAEGGVVKTRYYYDITNESELAMLVERELNSEKSDSYTGSITTFLEPFAMQTMIAKINDPVYQERSGEYYIESVETTFGTGGGRRKIEIGAKI